MKQDLPIDLARFNGLPHSAHDSLAAGELLAELRTGAVIPGDRSGEGWEEQAVQGALRLAPCARRLLGRYEEARRFEIVAVEVLDHLIRPRTIRWRRWLAGRGGAGQLRRRHLRRELNQLQRALPRIAELLEAVRDGRDLVPDDLFMGVFITTEGPPPIRARRAREPVAADIADDKDGVFALEKPELLARRVARKPEPADDAELRNVSGLALSGGGIRSATFSLGLVQVLARRGLFDQLDYLSTVSGGGYLGTFLSAYLNRPGADPGELFGRLGEPADTPAVRHLRNHSKYLGEGGPLGRLKGFLLMVFGIATNLIALLPFVVLAVLVTWALKEHTWVWGSPDDWATDWSELLVVSPAAVGAAGLLAAALVAQLVVRPVVSFLTRGGKGAELRMKIRKWYDTVATWLTVVAAAAAVFALLPLIFEAFQRERSWSFDLPEPAGVPDWLPQLLLALLPVLLSGPLANRFRDKRVLGTVLRVVFLVSGPLFLVWLYLFLGSRVFALPDGFEWAILGAMAGILAFLWFFMDLNALSPHGFYRDRLAECYLVQPRKKGEQGNQGKKGKEKMIKPLGRLDLSALVRGGAAPFHLVNACVNLPASREPELRGRKGDFFCFSKTSCGSRLTGYKPTLEVEKWDPGLDLGTAMAISGAAVSSSMAQKRLDHLRFFMTLLNARLGYWLPNVSNLGWIMKTLEKPPLRHKCSPGPDVLLCEMFGRMREDDTFVNLSDGGHIENLGVYELLKRRARFIIAVDGESDPAFVYDALIKLLRYARIDLGAEIDIDLSELDPDETGLSRAHSALGRITYRDGAVGWLVYAKLSLTGDETPDILDYRREQPSFPHQSTLDQLFEEEQFEAYRALGQHVAEELFRDEVLAVEGPEFLARSASGETDLATWFDALVRTMRSESDPVFRADPTNLDGWRIGISISNSPGLEPERINEATLSITKMLIAKGGAVVLGHDWRPGGVMSEIARFAEHDRLLNRRSEKHPAILNCVKSGEHDAPPAPVPEGRLQREVVGSLQELRRRVTELSDARICLGGKLAGFSGPIPGVLEEALLAARAGQTVLISAALGGAAGWLAESLLAGEPQRPLPAYRARRAARQGLPKSPAALVEELAERFEGLEPEERALHRRLWQTTHLDAAQAVLLEILGVARRRAPRHLEES